MLLQSAIEFCPALYLGLARNAVVIAGSDTCFRDFISTCATPIKVLGLDLFGTAFFKSLCYQVTSESVGLLDKLFIHRGLSYVRRAAQDSKVRES